MRHSSALRKQTGTTNRQIGDLFGRVSHSVVAKARERFAGQLGTDRSLQRTVQEITASISHVKPSCSHGSACVAIHLVIFDRLFLRPGRLERLEANPNEGSTK